MVITDTRLSMFVFTGARCDGECGAVTFGGGGGGARLTAGETGDEPVCFLLNTCEARERVNCFAPYGRDGALRGVPGKNSSPLLGSFTLLPLFCDEAEEAVIVSDFFRRPTKARAKRNPVDALALAKGDGDDGGESTVVTCGRLFT